MVTRLHIQHSLSFKYVSNLKKRKTRNIWLCIYGKKSIYFILTSSARLYQKKTKNILSGIILSCVGNSRKLLHCRSTKHFKKHVNDYMEVDGSKTDSLETPFDLFPGIISCFGHEFYFWSSQGDDQFNHWKKDHQYFSELLWIFCHLHFTMHK